MREGRASFVRPSVRAPSCRHAPPRPRISAAATRIGIFRSAPACGGQSRVGGAAEQPRLHNDRDEGAGGEIAPIVCPRAAVPTVTHPRDRASALQAQGSGYSDQPRYAELCRRRR